MGISGIVRAQTWEEAYSICEDEFFPQASETLEEMEKEYAIAYLCGRELWIYENGNSWEAWEALSKSEKDAAFQAPGKNVPFEGEFTDNDCWQEAFGFRPSGPNVRDEQKHGIYAKDMNRDSLDRLTDALLADLEITLEIEAQD